MNCRFCKKSYKKENFLRLHEEKCKDSFFDSIKPVTESKHTTVSLADYQKLHDQMQKLQLEINKMKTKDKKPAKAVPPLPPGQEESDYITLTDFEQCFYQGPEVCIREIMKMIYCDPNHPENMNILISNSGNSTTINLERVLRYHGKLEVFIPETFDKCFRKMWSDTCTVVDDLLERFIDFAPKEEIRNNKKTKRKIKHLEDIVGYSEPMPEDIKEIYDRVKQVFIKLIPENANIIREMYAEFLKNSPPIVIS